MRAPAADTFTPTARLPVASRRSALSRARRRMRRLQLTPKSLSSLAVCSPARCSKFAPSSPDRHGRVSEAPRRGLCQRRRGAAQLLAPTAAARDALAVRERRCTPVDSDGSLRAAGERRARRDGHQGRLSRLGGVSASDKVKLAPLTPRPSTTG
jgi:hypothetical protein